MLVGVLAFLLCKSREKSLNANVLVHGPKRKCPVSMLGEQMRTGHDEEENDGTPLLDVEVDGVAPGYTYPISGIGHGKVSAGSE